MIVIIAAPTVPPQPDGPPRAERITELIKQLGDDDFFVRERAQDELARLGIEATGGTAAAFQGLLKSEYDKWRRIIVDRKITTD